MDNVKPIQNEYVDEWNRSLLNHLCGFMDERVNEICQWP